MPFIPVIIIADISKYSVDKIQKIRLTHGMINFNGVRVCTFQISDWNYHLVFIPLIVLVNDVIIDLCLCRELLVMFCGNLFSDILRTMNKFMDACKTSCCLVSILTNIIQTCLTTC